MSQVIVDEQLGLARVVQPVQQWTTAQWIPHLRCGEHIDDDRIPTLLRELKQPTFVTIDEHFWNRGLRDARYCIVYFALRDDQQDQIPDLLRRLFRLPQFNTRAKRMGKVIRVSPAGVQFYQLGDETPYVVPWTATQRRHPGG
jgi:hypothetical protein